MSEQREEELMGAGTVDQRWPQEAEAVLSGCKEWRLQHPTATLSEIEVARARLLADAALASAAADLRALPAEERPRCPQCGDLLGLRGPEARHLTTTYEQPVTLRRHYAVCAAGDQAVFPPG